MKTQKIREKLAKLKVELQDLKDLHPNLKVNKNETVPKSKGNSVQGR